MVLSLAQVEQATHGQLLTRETDPAAMRTLRATPIGGWSIDSREIMQGDLFFAIKGDCFDGHAFVQSVLGSGAVAAVVAEPYQAAEPLLRVSDTLRALQQTARFARQTWQKPLIAVTGSAGKTSTKDIIAGLLSTRFAVGKTTGNFNNHIGLPLTLLRLPAEAQVAVVEIGMNHSGEIRELAEIARPQVGVVTNIGYAHIEAFSSIDGIAAAKRELIEALPPDGVAVLNADDDRVAAFRRIHRGRVLTYGTKPGSNIRAEEVTADSGGVHFVVEGIRFQAMLAGRHAASNILAGLAVARLFGIPLTELQDAVASLSPGKMRGERYESRGVTVLNDAYNSNPEAARSMIDVLAGEPARRKIAVLGEMLELGQWAEALHRELGRYAAEHGVNMLIGVRGASRLTVEEAIAAGMGNRAALFFETAEEAGEFLRSVVGPGDAVLFKGSRGTHIERALAGMEA